MTSANDKDQQPQGINRRRLVVFLLALPVYFALFMFLPAGTWAWTKGWLFIGVFLGLLAVISVYLWRVNPEVMVARSRSHEGTKRWDKILLGFLFPVGVCHRSCSGTGRWPISLVSGAVVGLWHRLCSIPCRNGDRHLGGSRKQVL